MKWRWQWETRAYHYPYYQRGEARAWKIRLWGLSIRSLHFGVTQFVLPAPLRSPEEDRSHE